MGLTAIVLGAAAGGGFPQWNCNCDVCRLAWAGDARVRPRTQASLAVSADGKRWTLLNASPDLRAQIQADTSAASARRQARQPDRRGGADRRRDRSDRGPAEPARALAVHADGDRRDTRRRRRQSDVRRARARVVPPPRDCAGRAVSPSATVSRPNCSWCRARCRSISKAKIPRPPRRPRPMSASRSADGKARLAYVPGAAAVTPALRERLSRANAILFDGTLFSDDEMIRAGTRRKDRPPHGPHADRRAGRLARGAAGLSGAAHLRAHQQHQSDPDRRLARARRASRPPAGRWRRTAWRSCL